MFNKSSIKIKISSIIIFLLISLFTAVNINAQPISFSGAEGYGRTATGGRGTTIDGQSIFLEAQVVEVTNLEDYRSGEDPIEGSFRWALSQQDTLINGTITLKIPTTIVFRVGGVINLKEDLKVAAKNLTRQQGSPPQRLGTTPALGGDQLPAADSTYR